MDFGKKKFMKLIYLIPRVFLAWTFLNFLAHCDTIPDTYIYFAAARLETFMFDTLPVDKIGVTNTRLTNLEYLGTDMIEAGNEFGPGTPYGSALIRVGQTEQALGEIEKEYIKGSHVAFCGPLHTFLDGEMKNIMRERKILENRRLDLDSCKGKVRKARAMQLQPAVSSEVRKFFIF